MDSRWSWPFPIPADLLVDKTLSPEARNIYLRLLLLCPEGERRCEVTRERLLGLVGLGSAHTLHRHLGLLIRSGWVRVHVGHGRQCTTYELLDPYALTRRAALDAVRARLHREQFKGEAIMKEWLNVAVDSQDFQDNARPGFLVNPSTGERLELDRWYTVGVAFEFNGPQHYGATDVYRDPQQAAAQRTRDLVKAALCKEKGIVLVVIHPEDLSLRNIIKKVQGLLPLREVVEHDPLVQYLTRISKRYQESTNA